MATFLTFGQCLSELLFKIVAILATLINMFLFEYVAIWAIFLLYWQFFNCSQFWLCLKIVAILATFSNMWLDIVYLHISIFDTFTILPICFLAILAILATYKCCNLS